MTIYKPPGDGEVDRALRLASTLPLRRVFYGTLKNPLWLAPLKDAGAFRSPQREETTDTGRAEEYYWPELEYVTRVAKEMPSCAIDIIIDLQDSESSWVRWALFSVGSVVPASEAVRLKPTLKTWLTSGFGWNTDPRTLIDFAVNLLSGGELSFGKWFATALFKPRAGEQHRNPDIMLDEYWYEAGVLKVVRAIGSQGFGMILSWLVEYETLAAQPEVSNFSRARIAERGDTFRRVEDCLIDATLSLAFLTLKNSPFETVSKLLRTDLILTRRIAMHVVASELADTEPSSESVAELIKSARRLLFDTASIDRLCRVEFGELARAVSRHSSGALDGLANHIEAGLEPSAARFRAQIDGDEEVSPATSDTRVAEYRASGLHLWLSAVGPAALTPADTYRLSVLDSRYGIIEDPLAPLLRITTWTGPTSALGRDEMALKLPEELVRYLESWHDERTIRGPGPSHEGQARELSLLIAEHPRSLEGVMSLVERLRPSYLRAIIKGWGVALKARIEFDQDQVVTTLSQVLLHGDEIEFPHEGFEFDDDPDFTDTKRSAIGLLVELVKKSEPANVSEEHLAQLADLLIDSTSNQKFWDTYEIEVRQTNMDPLVASVNWTWPVLVRGLAALVEHGPTAEWSGRARAALLREVGREDPKGSTNAVIGETIGRMINGDWEWTRSHLSDWFGTSEGISLRQQISLSITLAMYPYSRSMFYLLRPSIQGALNLRTPMVDGWEQYHSSPIERIGVWIISALIFGHIDRSDLLAVLFFSSVDASVRGASLGEIAEQLMHAETVSQAIVNRFTEIWDVRIEHAESNGSDAAELREFVWVVRCGKVSADWWLPRLKRVLAIEPKVSATAYIISEQIAASADLDIRLAFDVTKLLTQSEQEPTLAIQQLIREAVPIVMARALDSGDPQLVTEASEFMNQLGEAGNFGLARQVAEARTNASFRSEGSADLREGPERTC